MVAVKAHVNSSLFRTTFFFRVNRGTEEEPRQHYFSSIALLTTRMHTARRLIYTPLKLQISIFFYLSPSVP